jgi:hypothetical protein
VRVRTITVSGVLAGAVVALALAAHHYGRRVPDAIENRHRALAEEVAGLGKRVRTLEVALDARDQQDRLAAYRDAAPWVSSGDGRVAVRLWADSHLYAPATTSIFLGMEVRNTSDKSLVVSNPEIMEHTASLKIVGPQGELAYIGPAITRPPPRPVMVAPGLSARNGVEVHTAAFVGLNRRGRYRLTYHYYSGGRDVTWAGEVLVGLAFDVQ